MRPSGIQRATESTNTQSTKRIPVLRNLMQWTFCLAAAVLGFRVAHEMDLVVRDDFSRMEELPFIRVSNQTVVHSPREFKTLNTTTNNSTLKSSRVYVGRHPILIRPWPHPNPMEMAQAYNMIARVQLEQQRLYGLQTWKPIIAITPMYARTFQSVHLTGLLHTLSLVRGPVTWIVIEAEGVSAETAALLRQAKVHKLVHLGASKHLPRSLQDRVILESHLRIEGLRYVREQNLEGVVVFADDSNVYSMQFFDVIQKVQWVGALPVGILGHAGFEDPAPRITPRGLEKAQLQVQAPACDTSGSMKGWHGELVRDAGIKLEWAGFVLNARAVWAAEPDRPGWVKEWREWARPEEGEHVELRDIVRDESKVEALGACGREEAVLAWWARMEARSDSKFPSQWVLDSPLEIIVPAKRTPWPDRVFPPPSPPPPPARQTTRTKGGNRSGGRPRRGKRRPDALKSRPLENQRQSTILTKGMQS